MTDLHHSAPGSATPGKIYDTDLSPCGHTPTGVYTSAGVITFAAEDPGVTPPTITDASGGFIGGAVDFEATDYIIVTGAPTADNSGIFIITDVAAGVLTLACNQVLVSESGVAGAVGIEIPSASGLLAASVTAPSHHGSLSGLGDDDHTQYRLESADHSHQTTGLQGGQLDHGLAMVAASLLDDDHTQYRLESADHTHATTGAQAGQLDHGLAMVAASLLDDDHTQYRLESADHSHASTGAQGGQLDWDSVWADAVHSHTSDAEGGVLTLLGYTLTVVAANMATIDDAETYYFGSMAALVPSTTKNLAVIYIPKAGTIKAAYIYWTTSGGTTGSTTDISIYIRLNDSLDTLIETVGNTSTTKLFSNTALSIAVAQGNFIEIKMVCPTWPTNPAEVKLGGTIYIE